MDGGLLHSHRTDNRELSTSQRIHLLRHCSVSVSLTSGSLEMEATDGESTVKHSGNAAIALQSMGVNTASPGRSGMMRG